MSMIPIGSNQATQVGGQTGATQTGTLDFRNVPWFLVAMPGLATTETGTVSMVTANGNAPLSTMAGGPGLTATLQAALYPGGCQVIINKSVTAGAVAIVTANPVY